MNTIWSFMKRNYKIILLILGVSTLLWSFMPKEPKENPEKDQLLIEMITYLLEKGHYDPVKIDDTFSKDVYKEYIKSLDPTKRFFTQADIDEFSKYEYLIDDMIKLKDLSFFNLTHDRIVQRMSDAQVIYKDILSKPFNLYANETFDADYDKQAFSADEEALKKRWEKQLKLSVLSTISDKIKLQDGEEVATDEFEDDMDSDTYTPKTKKKDEKPVEKKTFAELEVEAREATLKSLNEYFGFIDELQRKDWFTIYVNSIVERFDPHSSYLAPEDKEKFDASMSGTIEGIGAKLQKKNDVTEISELIPGGPAWRGKELEAGDLILKVAQGDELAEDVVGMRLEDVVKKIKGHKGTEVRLTVKKVDGTVVVISIIREIVELEETYAKSSLINIGDQTYGLIQLPKFYINFENKDNRDAFKDVTKEVERLKAQNVSGIIMDLRNNGGGSLQTVVDMAGLFIEQGPIVQVKSSKGKKDVLFDRDSKIQWEGPLVVMVNNFSASASEIFAAAIQDYKRGVVIGSKHTYGKGTVQNVINLNELLKAQQPFGDLGALKLTLQKFYRINGGSTQREGVLSDVVLPDRFSFIDMGERDIPNAMPWDKIDRANYTPLKNDFSTAILNSKKRIATNDQFKLITENAKWINERKDEKVFSLNYDKYKLRQEQVEEKAKKFKAISKYNNHLKFNSLPYELERFKNDTILENKRNRWHESLASDVYVEEAVYILKDLHKGAPIHATDFSNKKIKLAEKH
ncbi:carboxy terminal-processing peptidase [Flavobacterium sp. HSC-61S13]|uniref:carboxy terminal-processing peptidase n=1 Tax=Flavobacterium sp. HSC-61S13 TaxID=2910963 RepID=UPI00209DAE89|nr:carboxy terminal-processing peptidase [Flavobacterium sp. HSC-61S13]